MSRRIATEKLRALEPPPAVPGSVADVPLPQRGPRAVTTEPSVARLNDARRAPLRRLAIAAALLALACAVVAGWLLREDAAAPRAIDAQPAHAPAPPTAITASVVATVTSEPAPSVAATAAPVEPIEAATAAPRPARAPVVELKPARPAATHASTAAPAVEARPAACKPEVYQ